MIRHIPPTDSLDWATLSLDSITLTPDQIGQAIRQSQSCTHPDRQWQAYLHALALEGFQEWVRDRAPELPLTVDRPASASAIASEWVEGVRLLQVNGITVALLATGALDDTTLALPRATVDLADYAAHLYVWVEVLDEQEQVRVCGSIRRDALLSHLTTLQPDADWSYGIALDWFDPEPDHVLLDLRLLSPAAIALTVPARPSLDVATVEAKLRALGDEVRSPQRQPWELLTWDEARTILTTPALQQGFAGEPAPPTEPTAAATPASNLFGDLMQNAVNVGTWLRDQLDTVADEMAWVLMPQMNLATSAMRSTVEEFQAVTHQLQAAGLAIAPEARSAYRDLRWGNVALRLYAMAWAMPFDPALPDAAPEWSLLLVLGPQPNTRLPSGARLRVQDDLQTLVDRVRTDASQDAYLYGRVIGLWNEQFWVTIDLGNGVVVTLPPFQFNPDSVE